MSHPLFYLCVRCFCAPTDYTHAEFDTDVNNTNDAMLTFWYPVYNSDIFGELIRAQGGIGIQINANTRDMTFALVAVGVREPTDVPEPATLVVLGLGLAGLGLARRRK